MGFSKHIAAALFEQKSLTRSPDGRIVGDHIIIAPSRVDKPQRPVDWDPSLAIRDGFKKVVYVYRAINSLAMAVSKVPIIVSTRKGDGEWEPQPKHPLSRLFNRPNPKQARRVLMIRTVQALYLSGNAMVHKVMVNRAEAGAETDPDTKQKFRAVTELWPMAPIGWSPIMNSKGWIESYDFAYDGVNRKQGTPEGPFPAGEILHHRFEDPAKPFWGMSPLQPASSVIDTLVESLDWNRESMGNRTAVGGILTYSGASALTVEQYEQVREMMRRDFEGASNAGRAKLLGAGFNWNDNQRTAQEMDYVNSTQSLREDTLSVFGVPPVEAGFFDQATLANAEVSRKLFWEDAVVPLCDMLADDYRQSLVPHFGDPDSLFVEFDYDSIPALREDLGRKMTIFVDATTKAGVPYNEANQRLEMGFEEQVEGDTPFGIRPPATSIVSPDAQAVSGAIAAAKPEPVAPEPAGMTAQQVAAAAAIVGQVVKGEIPRDAGVNLIVLLGVGTAQAEQIMGSAGTDAPTTPNPKPNQPEPVPNPVPPELPKAFTRRVLHKVSVGLSDANLSILNDQSAASETVRKRLDAELRRQVASSTLAVDVDRLAEALSGGATGQQVSTLLGVDKLEASLRDSLPKAIEEAMSLGGERAVREIPSFDFNPGLLKAEAQGYGRQLVGQLMDSTRRGVDDLVAAFRAGDLKGASGEHMAAVLREAMGANGNQLGSLKTTWQRLLEAGKAPAKVAEKMRRVGRGMTQKRLRDVADNEAYTAVNRGQLSAWKQARAAGAVSRVTKVWINSDDDRVDEYCEELDGEAVDLDEQFYSALAGKHVSAPPEIHPGCRCGMLLEIIE